MPTRRDVLRLVGLATLATTVPGLAACGSDQGGVTDDAGLVASEVQRSPGDSAAVGPVVDALHGFAGDLYGAAVGHAREPRPLAVLGGRRPGHDRQRRARARPPTRCARCCGLEDSLDVEAFNGGLNALTRAVEGLAGSFERHDDDPAVIALDAANALFGDRATPWRRDVPRQLAASYGAGMQVVDWVGTTRRQARTAVNGWTADRTHDRIPEILPAGVVDELTRLVLVNALYFKAPWLVAVRGRR